MFARLLEKQKKRKKGKKEKRKEKKNAKQPNLTVHERQPEALSALDIYEPEVREKGGTRHLVSPCSLRV